MTHDFLLSKCKRCTPLCEGGGSRCKSSREHHFQIAAPAAVRDALRDFSIGAFAPRIPPWQRPAMHSSRKGTERRRRREIACRRQPAGRARGAREANHAGAAPAGGSDFHNKEEAVAVAQESEFLAVNQKIRVRIPAATPFHHTRAMPQSSRRRIANPLLPGASPGARSISGPSFNSRTALWHGADRGAISRGSIFSIGHEEDSKSAPFGSANRAPKAARDSLPQATRRASARAARGKPAGRHRGARPFPIPPKRWQRRTPLVSARDRCNSGWRIVLPCSSNSESARP